jgi:terminase small subunit-like protein
LAPLKNPRHERFCLGLVEGKSATESYVAAGYQESRHSASRLATKSNIQARLAELQQAASKKTELSIQSIIEELTDLTAKATNRNQFTAAIRAVVEKARIAGLLVERVEIGEPGGFEAIDNLPDLIAEIKKQLGPDGAELLAACFGLDGNGAEVVKSGSRASFRRKLEKYRYRRIDERLLTDAVGRNVEVEITLEDVAELRSLMAQFDELVDGIRGRSARVVNAVDPTEIEAKRITAERRRLFDAARSGNGSGR